MKTHSSSSLPILALLLVALAAPGAALAQSNGRGDSGRSSGGGDGGDPDRINCLTGAYCPPQRQRPVVDNSETCDQVRVRERIPGTSRYRVVYRCVGER